MLIRNMCSFVSVWVFFFVRAGEETSVCIHVSELLHSCISACISMSAEPADLSMPLHKLVWVCVCVHEGVCMQVCTVLGKVTSNAVQASRPLYLFLPLPALPTGYTELERNREPLFRPSKEGGQGYWGLLAFLPSQPLLALGTFFHQKATVISSSS